METVTPAYTVAPRTLEAFLEALDSVSDKYTFFYVHGTVHR